MRILACVLALTLAGSLDAATAYRFSDGKLYLDTKDGPELLTIVDLPNTPKPDQPDDPESPNDEFGLERISRIEAANVEAYDGKDRDQLKLGAYYTALASSVESGTIPSHALPVAVQETFRLAVGTNAAEWEAWKAATTKAFSDAPIETKEQAAQGLRDIGQGLAEDGNAVDWDRLIKFFIEVILPLIIKLIEGA